MKRLICLLLALMLLLPAAVYAEDDLEIEETTGDEEEETSGEAEWTFPVALEDMDPQFIVLANKHYKLDKSFVPKPLVKMKQRKADKDGGTKNGGVLKTSGGEMKLQETCAEALVAMSEGARKDGYQLYLKSAYRSWQTQNTMYKNRLKKNKGKEHCHEYGFILRYPEDKQDITEINYEPWHMRYVGVPVATYIMENGLCLEEFTEQLQDAIEEYIAAGGDRSKVEKFIQKPTEEE